MLDKQRLLRISVEFTKETWKAIQELISSGCEQRGDDWVLWGDTVTQYLQSAIDGANPSPNVGDWVILKSLRVSSHPWEKYFTLCIGKKFPVVRAEYQNPVTQEFLVDIDVGRILSPFEDRIIDMITNSELFVPGSPSTFDDDLYESMSRCMPNIGYRLPVSSNDVALVTGEALPSNRIFVPSTDNYEHYLDPLRQPNEMNHVQLQVLDRFEEVKDEHEYVHDVATRMMLKHGIDYEDVWCDYDKFYEDLFPDIMRSCQFRGAELYGIVAFLHKTIPEEVYWPKEQGYELGRILALSEHPPESLLNRYRIKPAIQKMTEMTFSEFLEAFGEMRSLPRTHLKPIQKIMRKAIRDSYVLCLAVHEYKTINWLPVPPYWPNA